MQTLNEILLVAAADWWEFAIGIVFFILYGIGQLMGARNEQQKKKPPPRPVPPPQRPQAPFAEPPKAGGAPPNQADPLRAEVEEFLRRAQGKPAQPNRPGQPQPPRQPTPPPARQMPPRRPTTEVTARPVRPVASPPRPLEPESAPARAESVAEHVARHVVTEVQEIAARTQQLGAEVALADDKLKARLQETFQHPIGHLSQSEQVVAKERAPTIAEEIRQLVSQPAGMRQLVIANEILRRPEERW